jgi:hypothetical protein
VVAAPLTARDGGTVGDAPDPRVLYEDAWVRCTPTHLVVRHYYFPFGGAKSIAYADVRDVTEVEMGLLTGKGRLWGTASPRWWAHLDLRRPRKHTALVLDVGGRVRPFLTPDDPARVRALVEARRA